MLFGFVNFNCTHSVHNIGLEDNLERMRGNAVTLGEYLNVLFYFVSSERAVLKKSDNQTATRTQCNFC